jgi:hypothetical protein
MATTPATKKIKTTSTTSAFTTLKKASCPTLSQSGFIDYEVSADSTNTLFIGLTGNSGKGYFSKAKHPVTGIIDALEQFQAKYPITSLALKDLYPGTSINSWSFLMAVLLAEGLVEPLEDNKRRYQLCDPDAFLSSLDKLKAKHQFSPHSGSARGKPKAKAKAGASMRKSKAAQAPDN